MQQPIPTKYIALALFLLLAIVGIALFMSLQGLNKYVVNVDVLPEDATISFNNEEINPTDLKLTPGTYTFTAKKEGFKDDVYTVQVIDSAINVRLLPEPQSPEALAFFDNPENQAKREEFGGLRAAQDGSTLRLNNPITQILPYDAFTFKEQRGPFSVDYGYSQDDKKELFLVISNSSPNGRRNAMDWLRQEGYQPANFPIEFNDYVNPFSPAGGEL